MNDDNITAVVTHLGAIPDNMIYWSKPQGLLKWAEENAIPTKTWEKEVDFGE